MVNALAAVLESPKNFECRWFPIPEVGTDDAVLRVEACARAEIVGGLRDPIAAR
jgi:hypothetical protein